jgi:hypothetical protein
MDRYDVEAGLTRIHALLGEGYAKKARELARAMKAELVREQDVDPLLLGWLRYYELKALYAGEAWQEAYDLFRHPEARPFAMPAMNAAWAHSVAAECASRLGRPEDVVRWAERCFELRRGAGDPAGAAQALTTACVLLERMGRADLNTPFADRLIELGLQVGAENAVIQGVLRLMDNYEARARTTIRRRLQKSGSLLPALRDPSFRQDAARTLARLRRLLVK